MASIGLRKPFFAKYAYTESTDTVSYSDGGILAKAVQFSASVAAGEDSTLYADDELAENERSFSDGTVSLTTDDLTPEASAAILGMTPVEVTVGQSKFNELVYDDDIAAPYLGIGVIIPKIRGGVHYYRAVVLPKVKFAVPDESATTRGQTIEWQTPQISGTIYRSDAGKHPYKREATFTSEADAIAYIKQTLNITEPLPEDPDDSDSDDGTEQGAV